MNRIYAGFRNICRGDGRSHFYLTLILFVFTKACYRHELPIDRAKHESLIAKDVFDLRRLRFKTSSIYSFSNIFVIKTGSRIQLLRTVISAMLFGQRTPSPAANTTSLRPSISWPRSSLKQEQLFHEQEIRSIGRMPTKDKEPASVHLKVRHTYVSQTIGGK